MAMDLATCSDKMFDPFFTTKVSTVGSGLGMVVVQSLIEQLMVGSIECESEVGKGTSFKVCIPTSKDVQANV